MKKIAILQSNYIPWKGYFDLIAAVDEFIIYDDVQYTRHDWRNRNQIKTPQGLKWLTVPVMVKGKYHQKIRDTVIQDHYWTTTHWKSLDQNYRRASCFADICSWLKPIYLDKSFTNISQLNRYIIERICDYLSIKTTITNSWDYVLIDGKTERLVDLCRQAGGTEYISGPSAKNYIDEQLFDEAGIQLTWFDYAGYPDYPQLWGDFVHGVSILDLLFNCGKSSPLYMKYVIK